jgi:outer membrane lipoprotein-sorting protein
VKTFFTNYHSLVATLLLVVLALPHPARGNEADELVAAINAVSQGEQVSRQLTMEMTDRRGKTRTRETLNYRKYYGEEMRTVLFYLAPANVRDTGFLIWDYPDYEREDDQWLYLPAMRKVRRISTSDRGDYFLGTDLTFEDMKLDGKLEPRDWRFSLAGTSESDGVELLVLEAEPRSGEIARELGYSRSRYHVDPSNYMIMIAEFWGLKGKPLKTLRIADVRKIDGIWTRHRLHVENHKTGHQTTMTFSDVDYKTAVKDSIFTRSALERGI